jgi:photoactive yellow protein
LEALETIPLDRIDEIGFGLIVMNRSGEVTGYNASESRLSRLPAERVVGRNFFVEVGPCTNNYLVAQRFLDCDELDEQLDYVFTFRMAPAPVRLRLLARAGSPRQRSSMTCWIVAGLVVSRRRALPDTGAQRGELPADDGVVSAVAAGVVGVVGVAEDQDDDDCA